MCSRLHSSSLPNLQVANQGAKVATQRNVATLPEIFAFGPSAAFVFFQLLRTIGNFELILLCGHLFLLKNGGERGIRTLEPREGLPVFKTGVFNRSTSFPLLVLLDLRL